MFTKIFERGYGEWGMEGVWYLIFIAMVEGGECLSLWVFSFAMGISISIRFRVMIQLRWPGYELKLFKSTSSDANDGFDDGDFDTA